MYQNAGIFMQSFIDYLSKTYESSWLTSRCRSRDDSKNCLLGHLFNFCGDERIFNKMFDMFQEVYATEYMFFPVNDGKNLQYQQTTAKERCIAYLNNLLNGQEKTTYDLMDECYKRFNN